MRFPRMTTTASGIGAPPFPSIRVAPTMAIMVSARAGEATCARASGRFTDSSSGTRRITLTDAPTAYCSAGFGGSSNLVLFRRAKMPPRWHTHKKGHASCPGALARRTPRAPGSRHGYILTTAALRTDARPAPRLVRRPTGVHMHQDLPVASSPLSGLVDVQPGAVVSRALVKRPTGTVTLFMHFGPSRHSRCSS